jgi:hypothetical protein
MLLVRSVANGADDHFAIAHFIKMRCKGKARQPRDGGRA